MDMLGHSLDTTSQEKQEEEAVQISQVTGPVLCPTPGVRGGAVVPGTQTGLHSDTIQHQIHTEGGQVTYRVVQVTDQHIEECDGGGGAVSVVSTAAFTGAPQAVIQDPFSHGGSPTGEEGGVYLPPSTVSKGPVSLQTAENTLTQTRGQFYVMMTPPEVVLTGTQRGIAAQTQPCTPKMEGRGLVRDERRRAQHNEVERRRRDKINNWIISLSRIIPECTGAGSKTGTSKGGILSKACDYIQELRRSNQVLQEGLRELHRTRLDNDLCRQQIEELRRENALLRSQLQQHGIQVPRETPQ